MSAADEGDPEAPAGGLRLRAEVEAAVPAAWAFAAARNFRAAEARAREAGVQLYRAEAEGEARIRWRVAVKLRGRLRRFTVDLLGERPGRRMEFAFASRRLEGLSRLDFAPLPGDRCRIAVTLAVAPRTRAARLMLGGARLIRGRLEARLVRAIARRARRLEARWEAEKGGGA